jgi:hypothetical protein
MFALSFMAAIVGCELLLFDAGSPVQRVKEQQEHARSSTNHEFRLCSPVCRDFAARIINRQHQPVNNLFLFHCWSGLLFSQFSTSTACDNGVKNGKMTQARGGVVVAERTILSVFCRARLSHSAFVGGMESKES